MNDEGIHEEFNSSPSNRGLKIAIAVLIIAMVVGFGWALSSHHNAEQLAASRDELQASLSQTRSQVDALTAKLNAMTTATAAAQAPQETAPEQGQAAQEETAPRAEKRTHTTTKKHVARRHASEDPRWKQVQSQLDQQKQALTEQQKQLQDTQANLDKTRTDLQSNLDSTRTELSGGIAKNHEELVALQRKGERNYYEFDLAKSKQFRREGPLSISVRKVNVKHGFADLTMLVNDAELTRKHVNLYEPIMFRPEGYIAPVEIVINNVQKDRIHGYVSEPKYKPSELNAGAAQTTTTPAASSTTTQPSAAAQPTSKSNDSTSQAALQRRDAPSQ